MSCGGDYTMEDDTIAGGTGRGKARDGEQWRWEMFSPCGLKVEFFGHVNLGKKGDWFHRVPRLGCERWLGAHMFGRGNNLAFRRV